MNSGAMHINMTGQEINLIGIKRGEFSVETMHVKLQLKGEGNKVMALGTNNKSAKIRLGSAVSEIVINAAQAMAFGAEDENLEILGKSPDLLINL